MVRAIILTFALTTLGSATARAHPLHTSLAQVTRDSKTMTISVRVFADDVAAASKAARKSESAYIASRFALRDAKGAPIRLGSCGEKRVGDLVWICLRTTMTSTMSNLTVLSSIFFEKYGDQINIVSVMTRGKSTNVIFSPGDKPRRIG